MYNGRKKRSWRDVYTLSKSDQVITFSPEDGKFVRHPHNDALVISAHLNNYLIKRMLVSEGSVINALS